jgi:endonuclease/exonuclease/phosphatase family metal-dependent hydrolase
MRIAAVTLTVITLNLRFNTPKDGPHAWPHRREAVGTLLRERAPDVIGTQEGLAAQLEELEQALPGYRSFGVARGSPWQDEHCRVFFRSNRLRLRQHGDFWLSETPDRPGSAARSWGNSFPRMVTWGEFEPIDGGAPFSFLNTHLDHESAAARERGAELIVRFLRRPEIVHPAVVCGDMNAGPDSPPLQILAGKAPLDGEASRLRDTFRLSGGTGTGSPTFHGFTGRGTERIDYILAEAPFQTKQFEVLDQPVNGRWVSDHFPVLAVLEFQQQPFIRSRSQ